MGDENMEDMKERVMIGMINVKNCNPEKVKKLALEIVNSFQREVANVDEMNMCLMTLMEGIQMMQNKIMNDKAGERDGS